MEKRWPSEWSTPSAFSASCTWRELFTDNLPVQIHFIIEMMIKSSRLFVGPASRHGSVNSPFQVALYLPAASCREREFFIDNPLVRIHFIIEMIWWTGLAP